MRQPSRSKAASFVEALGVWFIPWRQVREGPRAGSSQRKLCSNWGSFPLSWEKMGKTTRYQVSSTNDGETGIRLGCLEGPASGVVSRWSAPRFFELAAEGCGAAQLVR